MKKSTAFKQGGFTLVELMIVVAVIAVIVGIAVPAWMRARESAQKAGLINEIRNNSEAFQTYATDHLNNLPPTADGFQIVPTGMASYLPQKNTWTTSPDGGGYWWWFNNTSRFPSLAQFNGFIALSKTGLSAQQIQDIDSLLDDGNLDTGSFKGTSDFLFYGIQ